MMPLTPEAFRSACSAIAAADFDVPNRIKSLVQVAHESLGTSSIVVYEYNPTAEGLALVAMAGVAEPELMRGPTDNLEFRWNVEGEPNVLWIEDELEYTQHLKSLAQITTRHAPKERGDFRKRELQKHANRGEQYGTLATAKIYLRKGAGHTNDPVGQAFFNFWKPSGQTTSMFTSQIQENILLVTTIIRELLIDKAYHQKPSAISWAPERLLREINAIFDTTQEADACDLEAALANMICQAALGVTQNYSGKADFIFLIGDRITRTFGNGAGEKATGAFLPKKSMTQTCIRERRYFVANIIQENTYPYDFDPTCRSAMIAPVMHDGVARAVIRLTSPVRGYFLDSHAKAMQILEQFARYGILRLDEWLQRRRIVAALRFYTDGANLLRTGEAAPLMQGVLKAMNAEWGTFWPIERPEGDNLGRSTAGIRFRQGEPATSVEPTDPEVGIRKWWDGQHGGCTEALMLCNRECPGTFFAIHALSSDSESLADREFDIRVYSSNEDCCCTRENTRKPCQASEILRNMKISSNTSPEQHTRLTFVVDPADAVKGVVWLKFNGLRDISWWERDYVNTLSQSLAQFMGVQTLHLAQKNFRHRLLDISGDAKNTVASLIRKAADENLPDIVTELQKVHTYMLTVLWRTQEVRALLPPTNEPEEEANPDFFIGKRRLQEYVNMARDIATSFKPDPNQWRVHFDPENISDDKVSGIFYSTLANMAMNIREHGWTGEPVDKHLAVIWIRKDADKYRVTVGNNGKPCESDPLALVPGTEDADEHRKIGLHVAKAMLELQGGDIRWWPVERFLSDHPTAPEDLKRCVTFFEFTIAIR
ncbi:MAG: hypothetical protein QGG42_12110 [Phycisphaerae bacterium]|jgi:hypothetical protein|nr:hypothetical protein [Phycisphaerae bacterium]